MTNPTESWASLHAYLSYRDAPAALRWLADAFGFEVTIFQGGQGCKVATRSCAPVKTEH